MRSLFFILYCIFYSINLFAQTEFGKITYRIKKPFNTPAGGEFFEKVAPAYLELNYELIFSGTNFSLKPIETTTTSRTGSMTISPTDEDGIEYVDIKKKEKRTYYLFKNQWFYTSENVYINKNIQHDNSTKIILGYKCKKAIVTYNNIRTECWYTPEIPQHYSPLYEAFYEINGAVLEYHSKYESCIAKNVDIKKINTYTPPPQKGRLISKLQLQDLKVEMQKQASLKNK